MIDEKKIRELVNRIIEGTDLFIVELKLMPGNAIELVLDSDTQLTVNDCARVNREMYDELDATETDDFELTVFSAGLPAPLKLKRQYIKNIGREMDANLKSGRKIKGTLTAVNDNSIEIEYISKEKSPEGKGKVNVVHKETIADDQLKSIKQIIKI